MVPLLNTINTPDELRRLDRKQLPQLADELRQFLVESVSKTGGHLSSNLGTVELTSPCTTYLIRLMIVWYGTLATKPTPTKS